MSNNINRAQVLTQNLLELWKTLRIGKNIDNNDG